MYNKLNKKRKYLIKEKIRKASELMMQRNYQAYKDLENK